GGREELGHSKVRDPPAVLQVSPREPLERIGRIAHAVDEAAEPQLTGRTDQEFLELARPLPVSPVADPHEVPGPPLEAERLEYARIGRLVPSPGARGPATPLIELPQHLPEREHAVVVRQIVYGELVRSAHRTMMGIVKEQPEALPRGSPAADRLDERRIVPFMHDRHVDRIERGVEIERGEIVERARETRVDRVEYLDLRCTVCGEQMPPAPALS